MLTDVANTFDAAEVEAIERDFGAYKRRRSSFYKAYNRRFPPIRTLQELENCHQLRVSTLALENVPPGVFLENHEARVQEALWARLLQFLDHVQHMIA